MVDFVLLTAPLDMMDLFSFFFCSLAVYVCSYSICGAYRLIMAYLQRKRKPLEVPKEPSTDEEQDEMRPADETKPEEDEDLIEPAWRPKLKKKRKRKAQGW